MKCVLCAYDNDKLNDLKEHYIKVHSVDQNNSFFKKLIDQKENNVWRKCNYCNEFVLKKHEHNFLKHYGRGFTAATVDSPLINTIVGDVHKLEITFKQHASDYDFFDPTSVVDAFLANVKRVLVKRYVNDVLIRAGFSIENIQQPLDGYSEPLLETRYWSTEPLQTKSFNDFVQFKIRESILKRVVNNRLSGSAWSFNKFNYLNIKVLSTTAQVIR